MFLWVWGRVPVCALDRQLPRSDLVLLLVSAANTDDVARSLSTYAHDARYSRGTSPQMPQTKTKMMVVRTSAPSWRLSPTTVRRVEAEPRRTWEKRGWTSRTAKWLPQIPRQRGLWFNVERGLRNNRSSMREYSEILGEISSRGVAEPMHFFLFISETFLPMIV